MSAELGFDLRRLAVPAYGPSLLFGAAEGALLPIIPAEATSRGAGVALAAFIAMLFGLGSFVSNIPASGLTDRFGERRALVFAGLVAALGCVLAMLPSLVSLIAGVFVIGMASAVFLLARQKYLTEAVPITHRARALSLLGGVMRIGFFIGPLIGAALIGIFGVPAAWILAIACLLLAGWCATRMEDLPGALDAGGATPARVTPRDVLRTHLPVFATVGLGILLVQAVRGSRQVVIPLWSAHVGLDEQTTSLVYAISAGIDMLVFYPAGRVMDLRGRRAVAVPSMLLMAAALAVMPFAHTAATVLAVSCVLGFGNGMGSGLVMTLGADFSPDVGRAAFLGIWRQLSDTGNTLGPLTLSGVTALVGLAPAVAVNALLGLAAAGVLAYWPARLVREGWGPHGRPQDDIESATRGS